MFKSNFSCTHILNSMLPPNWIIYGGRGQFWDRSFNSHGFGFFTTCCQTNSANLMANRERFPRLGKPPKDIKLKINFIGMVVCVIRGSCSLKSSRACHDSSRNVSRLEPISDEAPLHRKILYVGQTRVRHPAGKCAYLKSVLRLKKFIN